MYFVSHVYFKSLKAITKIHEELRVDKSETALQELGENDLTLKRPKQKIILEDVYLR